MFYFCRENERNPFTAENRPVGSYADCLLRTCFQAEIAKNKKIFGFGSASARKLVVLIKKGYHLENSWIVIYTGTCGLSFI